MHFSTSKVIHGQLLAANCSLAVSARPAVLVQALKDRNIETIEGSGVKEVTAKALLLDDGRTVLADEVVWCTQAAPQRWLAGAPRREVGKGSRRLSVSPRSASLVLNLDQPLRERFSQSRPRLARAPRLHIPPQRPAWTRTPPGSSA